MEIIVCIKQVPDTSEVKIDPATNTLIRQGVPSIVNPFDKNALEAALVLKQAHGGSVTVISMGPDQAKEALQECIAMGADKAVLLSDRAFGGADTLATSYTLAAGIKKIGNFDLIICGKQAIDGDTAQVGPEIAEHLNLPQLTYAAGLEVKDNKVIAKRELEEGYEMVESDMPAVVTVVKSINEPRYPSIKGMMKAKRTEIAVWGVGDLDVDAEKLGLKGSPTQVRRIFSPKGRIQGEIINEENPADATKQLIMKLVDAKII